jgi:hypothetical protein
MYQFLNDEQWWKHPKEIASAIDNLGTPLPDITLEEVNLIKLPYVIAFDSESKPEYIIVIKTSLPIWIKINDKS